jgi:SRI (Set2 Rpb1 interacting) domain
MDKFRNKLPKDDLKKFAKEIGKTLVASDFKHNRVEDPTKITPKQEKKVRKYVKEYFDKAVAKKAAHDKAKEKKHHSTSNGTGNREVSNGTSSITAQMDEASLAKAEDSEVEMSDVEDEAEAAVPSLPTTPSLETPSDESLKRKREELGESYDSTPSETPIKRIKEEDLEGQPSPPPPPPPPPAEDMIMAMDEDADLAAQEEALMRENEEALIKENEEALREAEKEKQKQDVEAPLPGCIDDTDVKMENNGNVETDIKPKGFKIEGAESNGEVNFTMKEVNGNAVICNAAVKMETNGTTANDTKDLDLDLVKANGVEENRDQLQQRERKEVLSH